MSTVRQVGVPMLRFRGGVAACLALCACSAAQQPVLQPDGGGTQECAPGATLPGAPHSLTATPMIREALVHWTPPPSHGGCPILWYHLRTYRSGVRGQLALETFASVGGFFNGERVCFDVSAVNRLGEGAKSSGVCVNLPDVPLEPANVAAFLSGPSAYVTWTLPPVADLIRFPQRSLLPLQRYRIVASPGGMSVATRDASATDILFPELQEGTNYTFAVIAENAAGPSRPVVSNPVTPPYTSWVKAVNLPAGRARHGSFIWNEFLFVIGGYFAPGGTSFSSALDANGAPADWRSAGAFNWEPYGAIAFASAADGSQAWVFSTGGSQTGSGVFRANIRGDGTLGPIADLEPMLVPRYHHASIAVRGHLYVLGGVNWSTSRESTIDLVDVRVAAIGADGSLGSWRATNPLPSPRHALAVATDEQHLYALGGDDGRAARQNVWFARIRSDGSLEAWQQATAQLPAPRYDAVATIVAGRVLLLGIGKKGSGSEAEFITDVLVGTIDSQTGDIASWHSRPGDSVIGLRDAFGVAVSRSTIYVTGGEGYGYPLNTVQYGRVDPQTGHLVPQRP